MVLDVVLLLRRCLRPLGRRSAVAVAWAAVLLPCLWGMHFAQAQPATAGAPWVAAPASPVASPALPGATALPTPPAAPLAAQPPSAQAGSANAARLAAVLRLFVRPQGHLLIVGGGETPVSVQQRVVALAGAENARIAVFPMASSKSDEEALEVARDFSRLGAFAQPQQGPDARGVDEGQGGEVDDQAGGSARVQDRVQLRSTGGVDFPAALPSEIARTEQRTPPMRVPAALSRCSGC